MGEQAGVHGLAHGRGVQAQEAHGVFVVGKQQTFVIATTLVSTQSFTKEHAKKKGFYLSSHF
jgi:hypothetical protein